MQDKDYSYNVGDEYPRKGLTVLPSRVKELASNNNRRGEPLIEEVPDKKTKSEDKPDKE